MPSHNRKFCFIPSQKKQKKTRVNLTYVPCYDIPAELMHTPRSTCVLCLRCESCVRIRSQKMCGWFIIVLFFFVRETKNKRIDLSLKAKSRGPRHTLPQIRMPAAYFNKPCVLAAEQATPRSMVYIVRRSASVLFLKPPRRSFAETMYPLTYLHDDNAKQSTHMPGKHGGLVA